MTSRKWRGPLPPRRPDRQITPGGAFALGVVAGILLLSLLQNLGLLV